MIRYTIKANDMKIDIEVGDIWLNGMNCTPEGKCQTAAILSEAAHEIIGVIENITTMPFDKILEIMKATNEAYPVKDYKFKEGLHE